MDYQRGGTSKVGKKQQQNHSDIFKMEKKFAGVGQILIQNFFFSLYFSKNRLA